jgi:hypothetical protein
MQSTDFDGDGNISDIEHLRSENKHILELMSQKVNETALSKLQKLNIGQVSESFASDETQDALDQDDVLETQNNEMDD